MTKNIICDLDLNGNKLKNVVADVLSSAPQDPAEGQFYYDSVKSKIGYYNGSNWVYIDPTGGGTFTGKIGGRNLLTDSSDLSGNWSYQVNNPDNYSEIYFTNELYLNNKVAYIDTAWKGISKVIECKGNETYTYSAAMRTDESNKLIYAYIAQYNGSSWSYNNEPSITLSNTWKRYSFTKTTDSDTIRMLMIFESNTSSRYLLSSPKLEIGDVPTDWTPAPEDTINPIIGGLNLVYGSASMHSGSDAFSWRASGGTVSTQSISSDTSRPLSNFDTCIRCTNGGSSATNIGIAQDGHHVSFKAGDKLTQSLWIRVSTAGSYSVAFQPYYSSGSSYSQGDATLDLTTDWTRISYTTNIVGGISGTASVGYFYIHSAPIGFYFEACGMKVENGDTPTDWTPAPQDIFLKENGLPEANLVWGGKDFAGDFSPLDAALVSELGANRLAFANASGITIEYSRNAGSTWTDYGATDVQKLALTSVLSYSAFAIGKADSTNKATANGTNYQLRITIDTSSSSIYTVLNKIIIYVSTNGSNASNVTIQKATHGSQSTFVTQVSDVPLSGWSGYNVINLNPFITTYGNRDDHYQKLRFIFKANGGSTSYNGLNVLNIFGYGGVGWNTPSSLAKTGHIYSYDPNKNVSFPAEVNANAVNATAFRTTDFYCTGTNSSSSLIHFTKSSDSYGDQVRIGGGGNTTIGAGESPISLASNTSAVGSVGDESLVLCADSHVKIYTGANDVSASSLGNSKYSCFKSDGNVELAGALKLGGGRVNGSGDDEGLVINNCSNGFAGLCLGNPSGKRAVFYHNNSGTGYSRWRFNNGSTSYDLTHPAKNGTIATTDDITVKSVWTGTLSAYNSATKTAGTLYLISG